MARQKTFPVVDLRKNWAILLGPLFDLLKEGGIDYSFEENNALDSSIGNGCFVTIVQDNVTHTFSFFTLGRPVIELIIATYNDLQEGDESDPAFTSRVEFKELNQKNIQIIYKTIISCLEIHAGFYKQLNLMIEKMEVEKNS